MGGGGNAFWNIRRHGGVKTFKASVAGYGYFLELPVSFLSTGMTKESYIEAVLAAIEEAKTTVPDITVR